MNGQNRGVQSSLEINKTSVRTALRVLNKLAFFLILSLIILSRNGIAADLERGRLLFKACTRCHGSSGEGNKELQAPRIIGREDWYIKSQLLKFREKQRGYGIQDDKTLQKDAMESQLMHPKAASYLENDQYSKLMHPIIMLMDDEEIECVVAYISEQKIDAKLDFVDGDIKNGKKLYSPSCSSCHGVRAQGQQKLKAPRLLNQHGWYLLDQ